MGWSLGIVLLEVFDKGFCTKLDQCEKEKSARALVEETVPRLGAKPIPSILKALLSVNPSDRLSAQEAHKRLHEAVSDGTDAQADLPAAQLRLSYNWTMGNLPQDVLSELRCWTNFFRPSGMLCHYAGKYAHGHQG